MRTSPSRYKVAMVTVHVGHTIGSVQSGSVSDKGPIKTDLDTKYLAQDGSEKGGIATLLNGSGAAAGGRSASRGRGMVSSVVDVVDTRARNVSERRK